MSGGDDWGKYYDALAILPFQYTAGFLFFICFSIFAVVNIVTGVFVDCAMNANKSDTTVLLHEEEETKKAYLDRMRGIFEEIDDDDTGYVSHEEFERNLSDERLV